MFYFSNSVYGIQITVLRGEVTVTVYETGKKGDHLMAMEDILNSLYSKILLSEL